MTSVRATRRGTATVLLLVAMVLSACTASTQGSVSAGKGGSTSGPSSTLGETKGAPKGGQSIAAGDSDLPDKSIKLAKDVVVVRNVPGKTIKGLGNDGASLLLDASDPSVKKLQVGSVMLLTGVGAGRVTQIDDTGGGLAVGYQSVSLPEVIQDGTLNWDNSKVDSADGQLVVSPEMAEVSGSSVEKAPGKVGGPGAGSGTQSSPAVPSSFRVPGDPAALQLVDAGAATSPSPSGNKVEGTAGKFKFEFEWIPSDGGGGNAKLDLTPNSDFNGKIGVDVQFDPLDFGGGTKVSRGKVDFFNLDFKHLSGKAKITGDLSALKQTAALTTLPFLKIPASVSFPVPIMGIPFTLSISATIQVSLSIALPQNSLHAEAEIDFGGPAGFNYRGGSVKLVGARSAAGKDMLSEMKGIANGPVGLVFTTELPKVSFGLKILQTGAGVFVSNGMVTSFWIAQAPVMCRLTQVASVVAGGIDASFAGTDITFTRKPFLDKRWEYFTPKDDKRCGDIGSK